MADLFTLFDGSMGAGGGASVSRQTSDSFSLVSSENDLVATLASGSDSVDLLIDYSDFSNFVTFNSAESYVTVTADQILNSYPRDGSADDVQVFRNSLDGYQRYFLENWPSTTGHLRLTSSFVRVDDFGVQDGVSRTSFINPGTGSFSIQGWLDVRTMEDTGDVGVVFSKSRADKRAGINVHVDGFFLVFMVHSASTTASVAAQIPDSMPMFFAGVLDRSTTSATISIYAGSTGSYPELMQTSEIPLESRFDLTSGSFYLGSGSVPIRDVRTFSGSMDAISVWSTARTLADMTGTYNRRIYAQPGLIGLWNFNDATADSPASYASIVRDSSGHRLDGRIQGFSAGVIRSGSLAFDSPEPILSLEEPSVVSYVLSAQESGSIYDRNNQSLIFNLFPESFSQGDPTSADVFRNFALILARHFDRIKTYVNQLSNLRRVHYGDFDQAPDEVLDIVARSFGWDLGAGFATSDALRYFVGRGVRPGPQGNDGEALADVKAAFWRRILLNLMYLYKTKGTGESVESLLRIYGVNSGFIRLKEYARREEQAFPLARVLSEKSVNTLMFSSGSSVSFGVEPLAPPSGSTLVSISISPSPGVVYLA